MEKNRFLIVLFIVLYLILSINQSSIAGPPGCSPSGPFEITVPNNVEFNDGLWQMVIISVGEFERENEYHLQYPDWVFGEVYDGFKNEYTKDKLSCGGEGVLGEISSDVLNPQCKNLVQGKIDYALDWLEVDGEKVYDGNYSFISASSSYLAYLYNINNNEAVFHPDFNPSRCILKDNKCTFVEKKLKNPFVIILERVDSTDEIYFSDTIIIPVMDDEDPLYYCDFGSGKVEPEGPETVKMSLTTLSLNPDNSLGIDFNEDYEIIYQSTEDSQITQLYSTIDFVIIIIGILIIIVIAVWLLKYRK